MDQDFHYYGTYTAARLAGWDVEDALLIARCANYVDFFDSARFGGPWNYRAHGQGEVGGCGFPRITFNMFAINKEGMWSAFHFTPGNYKKIRLGLPRSTSPIPQNHHMRHKLVLTRRTPENPRERVLTSDMKTTTLKLRKERQHDHMWRLTRPLSHLSRCILQDTHELAMDLDEVGYILHYGPGLREFLVRKTVQRRFLKILTGIRSHVICDTWAHQDHVGIPSRLNTYWDVDNPNSRGINYGIKYTVDAQSTQYNYIILGRPWDWPFPNMPMNIIKGIFGTLGLAADRIGLRAGHGWLGHIPDYSFMKFKYCPLWKDRGEIHTRNNPVEYMDAFYDLYHFLSVVQDPIKPIRPLKQQQKAEIAKAIGKGWTENTGRKGNNAWFPRVLSAEAWRKCINTLGLYTPPTKTYDFRINTLIESGDHAELKGGQKGRYWNKVGKRYDLEIIDEESGEPSDFYLFQLAADYHFQYVKSWLLKYRGHQLEDAWSTIPGPLGEDITTLTNQRVIGRFKARSRERVIRRRIVVERPTGPREGRRPMPPPPGGRRRR